MQVFFFTNERLTTKKIYANINVGDENEKRQ